MIEFLQGILAFLIAASFFALVLAPFALSGRHAAEEQAEEDRHQYFQQRDLARRRQTWRARG